MPDFREALDSDRVVLFDGAMGTELYRRGVFVNRCYDALSLDEPELVREIHRDYRRAGAEVLETNTFGGNRMRLQSYGEEGRVQEINRAAARLAREEAGEELFVGGSMGPLGVRLEPYGPTSEAEARDIFRQQAELLAEGGVDLLVLETFSDLSELRQAVEACRATDLPVLAQMTIQPDGRTSYGVEPEQIAAAMEDVGADAVGLNCSVGPAGMLEAVERMAESTRLPISAIPNAGMPQEVEGRKMYMASPEYMATYARRLVEAGARMVGGCCGTGPDHVREMARQLEEGPRPRPRTAPSVEVRPAAEETEPEEPTPLAERSDWGRKLDDGEPVTCVEVQPPRGSDPTALLEACRRLKEAGVDAVNVPDGARASVRMGVIAAATLVQRKVGIEALAHYTCRDRNLLGMTGDLLGAQALGLRNLLLVTGDPPKTGPYPDATAVFDVDSIGLTNLVRRLNHGQDVGGTSLGSRTEFVIGVGVNPDAEDREREMRRWYWKVDAGAEYAITQPVFDVESLVEFLSETERRGTRLPVVASVWPLTGLRNAEFLNNEVPGIRVPERILDRMRQADERGESHARAEGRAVAREIAAEVREMAAGVQVIAPEGDVEQALGVLR